MTARQTRCVACGALVLCLALALGGQAMADSLVPDASGAETGAAVGRAASSYLTGIKRYAAAALWNRLDPVMHGYYEGESLPDQRYMLSTIALVQALDPTATQSYSVGSWILIQNDRVDAGMDMARRGVEANPKSGTVLANYAQLQSLYGDEDEAVAIAKEALESDVVWTDRVEQVNAYAAMGSVFRAAGLYDLNDFVQSEIDYLDTLPEDSAGSMEHDHDGDGVPDH